MTYLLYGNELYLIKKEIDTIQNKEKISDISVVKYDFSVDSLNKIIDECNSLSLFEDKKMIIVSNTTIFNRNIKNKDSEAEEVDKEIDYTILIDYLNHQNENVLLIFINNQETIDNSKKITKLIKEKGIVKELNAQNVKDIVKKMFNEYQISYDDIDLLINRVGKNLNQLNEEINKIKIYKDQDLKITRDDIINLTSLNIDLDIFNFVDTIVNKEKDKAITIYREMLTQNNDPTKIMGLLASKFRMMYQAHELSSIGYSIADICKTLNAKEYPVTLALKSSSKANSKQLLNYLDELATLEINIKFGQIDAQLGIQLFILNI